MCGNMKVKKYYLSFGLISILFLTITASQSFPNLVGDKKTNKDIIKFSHKVHESVDCETCHTGVTEATNLSMRLLPVKDNCATCHDVNDAEQCNTCHYENVQEPLIQKKSDLIFNHKAHIEMGKKCTDCHQGLSEVDYSFESSSAKPKMETCYTCHNDRKNATNACEACHITTANLIPADHQKTDFIKFHKFVASRPNANCVMCHDNNSCETCHTGNKMLTETNAPNDFHQPFLPDNFIDGAKQQQITRVHDLNYRFTHGIDVKGKNAQCQTCHEVETFCVDCHASNGGDISLGGVMPSSHLSPNFVKFPGTNGGEHAILARRDIERCIACHDVQGQDPVCITCHTNKK